MRLPDIAIHRLHSHHLTGPSLPSPVRVAEWLGAVQSQDYPGAKWALGLRSAGATDAVIDAAFDAGEILRTHVMRPTWHFVLPADIRWLLGLTGPRVHATIGSYYRKHELDGPLFVRSQQLIADALGGGVQLTRNELATALARGGIEASGNRLAFIVMRAELDALICSGARRGRQFTYALLDERVPAGRPFDREAALAELTHRYFTSHGPATMHDFAWWSGLTMADVRAGLDMVGSRLESETIDDRTWWFGTRAPTRRTTTSHGVRLLPNYDEHIVAYRDHAPSLHPDLRRPLDPGDDSLNAHIIVKDGLVIGGWRRTVQKKQVIVKTRPLVPLDLAGRAELEAAAASYARFLGLAVKLE